MFVERTFSIRELALLGEGFLLVYPGFWQSWLDSDSAGSQNLTEVCRTWHLPPCFAQGLCWSSSSGCLMSRSRSSRISSRFFSRIRAIAITSMLSIYPCCSWKQLWFYWAWALCRGWYGLWFLQGTFLHFASVLEKNHCQNQLILFYVLLFRGTPFCGSN